MAVPVIVDCDPGHDDAIALVVAARHTELLGVTTVAGNAPIERTTRNALVILDLLGHDVPVHRARLGRCWPRPSTPATSTARAAWTAPTSPSPSGRWRVRTRWPSSWRPPAPGRASGWCPPDR